jgi:hypothetical protein
MDPPSTHRSFSKNNSDRTQTEARKLGRVHANTKSVTFPIQRLDRDVWSHVTDFLGASDVYNLDPVCRCVREWMIASGVWRDIPLVWTMSERPAALDADLSRLLQLKGFTRLELVSLTLRDDDLINLSSATLPTYAHLFHLTYARLFHLAQTFPQLESLTFTKPAGSGCCDFLVALDSLNVAYIHVVSDRLVATLPPKYTTLRKLVIQRNSADGSFSLSLSPLDPFDQV